jgi:hypothetical protein
VYSSTVYEGVSKSFQTELITKYTLTFSVITRQEATQRVMVTKLTRLAHKIAIQLHVVVESCTICSSHSRWPVWKLMVTPLYMLLKHSLCNFAYFSGLNIHLLQKQIAVKVNTLCRVGSYL